MCLGQTPLSLDKLQVLSSLENSGCYFAKGEGTSWCGEGSMREMNAITGWRRSMPAHAGDEGEKTKGWI